LSELTSQYVRFWHKADITQRSATSAFGGKADITHLNAQSGSGWVLNSPIMNVQDI